MKSFIIFAILVLLFVEGESSRSPTSTDDYSWTTEDLECCGMKIVGGKKYHLVGKSMEASDYGCTNDCTYTTEGSDVKYCFKPGQHASECLDEGGNTDLSLEGLLISGGSYNGSFDLSDVEVWVPSTGQHCRVTS